MAAGKPSKPGAGTPVVRQVRKPLPAGTPSAATAGILRRLGEEVASISDPAVAAHIRIGQVTAVDTVTLTATVAYGAGEGLTAIGGHHWLRGAQPVVNNYVMIVSQDGDNWIAGVIATSTDHPPSVRVRRTTAGTGIPHNAETSVTWESTVYDYGDMWTSGANVVIPVEGIYALAGGVLMDSLNTTGRRVLTLYKNASPVVRSEPYPAPGSATLAWATSVATEIDCAAGDVITLKVYQSSGSTLPYNTFLLPWMTASWSRPL
jgi:hypothetical protein